MDLTKYIHEIPDFPETGISFKDITPLLQEPKVMNFILEQFVNIAKNWGVNKIAAIESRGFIFGVPLAQNLQIPVVLLRKPGKLPKETLSENYGLEYGTDELHVHKDDINNSDKVLIIDDVLATGGTALAAANLITKAGGQVSGLAFLMELDFLKGREKLAEHKLESLLHY